MDDHRCTMYFFCCCSNIGLYEQFLSNFHYELYYALLIKLGCSNASNRSILAQRFSQTSTSHVYFKRELSKDGPLLNTTSKLVYVLVDTWHIVKWYHRCLGRVVFWIFWWPWNCLWPCRILLRLLTSRFFFDFACSFRSPKLLRRGLVSQWRIVQVSVYLGQVIFWAVSSIFEFRLRLAQPWVALFRKKGFNWVILAKFPFPGLSW